MTRNGIVFPLEPLARLTRGTGSGSLPTPTVQETVHKSIELTPCGTRRYVKNADKSANLATNSHKLSLAELVHVQDGGPLNPEYVEWLMGFPAGWTE